MIADIEFNPPKNGKEGQTWSDKDGEFYHDGNKWVRTNLSLEEVKILAEGMTSGLLGVSVGVSFTGCFGVGPQSGVDFVWLFRGEGASFFPYVVGSAGGGVGYNIDYDAHTGLLFYSGYKSNLTASNVLNTNLVDGKGCTYSVDASVLFKGGAYYSRSNATPNTRIFSGGASGGLSLTPGFNWYGGRYISKPIKF